MRPPSLGLGDLLASSEWEYRQELFCHPQTRAAAEVAETQTAALNELGKKRWELVDIHSVDSARAEEHCQLFTLKRRKK